MRRAARTVVICLALLSSADLAAAQLLSFDEKATCPDHGLKVDEVGDGRSRLLVARRSGVLEATVAISGTLGNAESSVPFPFTADVYGEGPLELTRLKALNTLKSWFYTSSVRWCPGRRGGIHDDAHVYALPYDSGRSFLVLQGSRGTFSHGAGSGSEHAVDFAVPAGFTVRAARSGVVVAVRQDSAQGGLEKRFESCANYVVVRHGDGTYASYAHLSRYSALVEPGQAVEEGTPLGRAGNTGFSSGPHLHFDVYRPLDGAVRETIAVRFRTTIGVVAGLQAGEEYARP